MALDRMKSAVVAKAADEKSWDFMFFVGTLRDMLFVLIQNQGWSSRCIQGKKRKAGSECLEYIIVFVCCCCKLL
jgi:hypothetical protein